MGSLVVVGPVRGENLVGLAAEQEVEFLLEDTVELFAKLSIEIGHLPATELEAPGWILGRPAGRLHDAIHGNHGADDNLPHRSLSLLNCDNKLTGHGYLLDCSVAHRSWRPMFIRRLHLLVERGGPNSIAILPPYGSFRWRALFPA